MLCERCKKNTATVHYTYGVNGKEFSYFLCGNCYHTIENHAISDMKNMLFPLTPHVNSENTINKCDLCGYTVQQILDGGRVGCARCYKTFSNEISYLIQKLHGNKTHISSDMSTLKSENELVILNRKLEQAISEEKYEDAAVLRDQILEWRKSNGMV